jgi:Zn-dependent protease
MKTGFVIGWAKPVPYNEGNLRNKKWGTILVASAGILANIGLALIFGILFRFGVQLGFPAYDALAPHPFYVIAGAITLVNLILAFFNLIPVPPLDGSKILFALLPHRFARVRTYIESFSLVLLLLFIFFFWPKLVPLVGNLFGFITGV